MVKRIFILFFFVLVFALTSVSASEKVVLFAMDDFQTWWLENIQESIVQVHIDNNIPVTLGVIPAGIAETSLAGERLIERIKRWDAKDNIEIAQHGYDHLSYFQGMPYSSQYNDIKKGKDLMNSINIFPKSFIPPFGSADSNTVDALKALGFDTLYNPVWMNPQQDSYLLIIQNQIHLCKNDGVGSGCLYKDYDALKSEIDNKINEVGVALVLYHMQDFNSGVDGSQTLDTTKVNQIIDYSSQLEQDGYTLMTVEEYYEYLNNPISPVCGNGIKETGEECDDNNLINNDGCSSDCKNEIVLPICGNSIIEETEICDSNSKSCAVNSYSGTQSCNSECNGWNTCKTEQFCGDEKINGNEQCDLGLLNTNTPCNALYGSSCTYCSTSCKSLTVKGPSCGDGIIQSNEQCDDGNTASGDGCSSTCKLEIIQVMCGNGIRNTGEQCDKGLKNGIICKASYGRTCNYCSTSCKIVTVQSSTCGDGVCSKKETCSSCSKDCGRCRRR